MLKCQAEVAVRRPHLTDRGRGERDGAMKMTDGSANDRAVRTERREGLARGGGDEGATLTAERAYLSAHLSFFFRLDLQVLSRTVAGVLPENRNRCHKTPR